MSVAKHTPGPWAIEAEEFEEYWCPFSHFNVGPALGIKSEQDARLIAAAPELLEALEGLLCWCQGYEADKLNPHAFSHMESARAAIAKATGSAQ